MSERSQNKMRPSLPRVSVLGKVPAAPSRSAAEREPDGRFRPGNATARHGGEKAAAKRLLGDSADPVAREASKLARGMLRDLPGAGASVRAVIFMAARATAQSSYYAKEAAAAGLVTERGLALADRAASESKRAERLLVTAFSAQKALVSSEPKEPPAWVTAPLNDEEEEFDGES